MAERVITISTLNWKPKNCSMTITKRQVNWKFVLGIKFWEFGSAQKKERQEQVSVINEGIDVAVIVNVANITMLYKYAAVGNQMGCCSN